MKKPRRIIEESDVSDVESSYGTTISKSQRSTIQSPDSVVIPATQIQQNDHLVTPTKRKRPASTLDDFVASPSKILQRSPISEKQFQSGAIVSIRLRNFLTYDIVDISPGPNLNMIIGPNGTGKSTIVCAIAIGLGFSPNVLGRAKDLWRFVKSGKDKGSTRIELFNPDGENYIIERQLKSSDNTSKFLINSQDSSHREVKALTDKLNIQVDNLCQFLPQDRVTAFAQLTPPELLRETQKAAGNSELLAAHQRLIDLRAAEKSTSSEIETLTTDLTHAQTRFEKLSRDVEQYNRREAALRRVRLVQAMIPSASYATARNEWHELKAMKQAAHAEFNSLMQDFQPIQDTKNDLEARKAKFEKSQKKLSDEMLSKEKLFTRQLSELDKLRDDINNKKLSIREAKEQEKQRQRKLQETTDRIVSLETQLKVGPPDHAEEINRIQEALRSIQDRGNEISEKKFPELRAEQREFIDRQQDLQDKLKRVENDLRGFEDANNRKLRILAQRDRACYETYMDLREKHKEKFEKPVLGPIWLEVDLIDAKYATAFENAVPYSFRKNFICQTMNDYRTFARLFQSRQGIGFSCNEDDSLEYYRPSFSKDDLQRYGFEISLFDAIKAPVPVLIDLCRNNLIHEIPIATGEVDHKAVTDSGLFRRSYTSGNHIYRFFHSRHGSKLTSSSVNVMAPSRFMSINVDTQQLAVLQRQAKTFEMSIAAINEDIQTLKNRDEDLRGEYDKIRSERNTLIESRQKLEEEIRQFNKLQLRLDAANREKVSIESRSNQYEEIKQQVQEDIKSLALMRANKALEIGQLYQDIADDIMQRKTETKLLVMQCESDMLAFQSQYREYEQAKRRAEEKLVEIDERTSAKKAESLQLLKVAERAIACLSDAEKDELQSLEFQSWSEQQLHDEAIKCQSEADLVIAPTAKVIEDYKRRQKEVEELTDQLNQNQAQLNNIKTELEELYQNWRGELDKIVNEISTAFSELFSKLGCSGEVRLNDLKGRQDFDEWGIEILVKFRDHEDLTALNGQRQSGGERSVSTIMYLMALQSLARAPFRVVDEINQGMDPRNERLVHGQLVSMACDSNTCQYFLITPKLLPDLQYHERMKVLCIFNGVWLPDHARKIKLRDHLIKAKEAKERGELWVTENSVAVV